MEGSEPAAGRWEFGFWRPVPCCSLDGLAAFADDQAHTALGHGYRRRRPPQTIRRVEAVDRSWFRSMFSISTDASPTASSVCPVMVKVLFRGLSSVSASDWTESDVRNSYPPPVPRTVVSPLPIIKPILNYQTTQSLGAGARRPAAVRFSGFDHLGQVLFRAVDTFRRAGDGYPSRLDGVGVFLGSASFATCTRTPKVQIEPLDVFAALPITSPTMPLGTLASYVFSPGRGADGMTRQLSPDEDATTNAPSLRAN